MNKKLGGEVVIMLAAYGVSEIDKNVEEARLVVDIPKGYMDILDTIKETIHVPKKGIVSRALRDYIYKHRNVMKVDKLEEFLEEYLEGK